MPAWDDGRFHFQLFYNDQSLSLSLPLSLSAAICPFVCGRATTWLLSCGMLYVTAVLFIVAEFDWKAFKSS